MRKRHVAGLVRRQGQREAAELRLHWIKTIGLGVERDKADVARAVDPGAQTIERAHGLIFGAVESLALDAREPRRGERLRSERAGFLAFRSARVSRLRRAPERQLW